MARKRRSNPLKSKGRFLQIFHEMFESDAYRSLNCVERCLLSELISLQIPGFREDVFLSTRHAARRLGVHPDTGRKAFHTLARKGFIKLTRGELWQARMAREWRLTFRSYRGREPSDEWRDFKKTPEPKQQVRLTQSKAQDNLNNLAETDL